MTSGEVTHLLESSAAALGFDAARAALVRANLDPLDLPLHALALSGAVARAFT